ncbi:ACP S-malonyltransferase [Ureibacillus sinduriensis]|uniref:Malonyl CoA-acyl carrier protein transacylase n=1 Tax=Ureibacillus sinduriensis BLB-1 = JCM 15800 TaxID=1384057 RepID=A0A0A3IN49_9BACL|nr:malonate decarboxylase subunit epsilon [Ureibacillus sinduriensis]KGR76257.1 malonate decarboxylase subunit epsilon [Ureibacillus sinduriensis BLB-1 = JCM 15800]
MKSAFLFPGQGSQYEGMLNDLPDDPVVKELLEESSEILNTEIQSLHSKNALLKTKAVQQCLLIASVASYRVFVKNGILPNYVAGHSVGAFGAAVASGVITFEEGLRLVTLRGELMENTCGEGYGMAVVLGLDEYTLSKIVNKLFLPGEPVYVSNRNAPTQVTLSGSLAGLQKVIDYVQCHGATSAHLLNVSTPSHSPLFQRVSEELFNELDRLDLKKPKIPISSNITSRLLMQADAIKEDLAKSICYPVRWHDAVNVLYESGTKLFIEMPPGEVLSKLAQQAFPDVRTMSIAKNSIEDCFYILSNS